MKETKTEKINRWNEEKKEREFRTLITDYLEQYGGILYENLDTLVEIYYGEVKKSLPLYEVLTRFMIENDIDAFKCIKKFVKENKTKYETKTAYEVLCELVNIDNQVNADFKTNKGKNINEFRKYVSACKNTKLTMSKLLSDSSVKKLKRR